MSSKAKEEDASTELVAKKTEAWRSKVAKGYDEHGHCSVCGRAIHADKKYCSIECKTKFEGVQKKQGKQNKLMCIIMPVIMAVMMLFMFMGG